MGDSLSDMLALIDGDCTTGFHGELSRLKAEAIPTAQLTLTFVVREVIKVGERCEDFGHQDGDL